MDRKQKQPEVLQVRFAKWHDIKYMEKESGYEGNGIKKI